MARNPATDDRSLLIVLTILAALWALIEWAPILRELNP